MATMTAMAAFAYERGRPGTTRQYAMPSPVRAADRRRRRRNPSQLPMMVTPNGRARRSPR